MPGQPGQSFAATDNPVIFWTSRAWRGHRPRGNEGGLGQARRRGGRARRAGPTKTPTATRRARSSAEASLAGTPRPTPSPPIRPTSRNRWAACRSPRRRPARRRRRPPKDNAFAFHTWWLWWIIPLALLVLASVVALMSTQRRRAARVFAGEGESDAARAYNVPEDRTRWSTPTGDTWQEPEPPVAPRRACPAAPTHRPTTGCSHIAVRMSSPTIRTPWTPRRPGCRAATSPTSNPAGTPRHRAPDGTREMRMPNPRTGFVVRAGVRRRPAPGASA